MYSGSFKYSDGMSGAQHLVGNRRIDKTATAEYDDFVHLRKLELVQDSLPVAKTG
jgi:hypothetical protein